MSASGYEREFRDMLQERGCFVLRSAGSLAVDLGAWDPIQGVYHIIEVKSFKPSHFSVRKTARGLAQWKEMMRLAKLYPECKVYYALRKKGLPKGKWSSWRLVEPKDLVKPFHWKELT